MICNGGKGFFFLKEVGGCPTFRAWRPNGSKKAPALIGYLRDRSTPLRLVVTSPNGRGQRVCESQYGKIGGFGT